MLVTPGSKKKAAQRAAQAKSGRGAGGKDMEIKNPDVDVVIPISGTMYLEHLRNCLRHLSRQSFPREDMGVIVSCLMHEAVDDAKLFELCKNHQATVVFTKPHQKAFNRGYALNIGARHGSRRMIALLDSDVVLHPDTIKISVNHCRSAVMAIIPVARTDKPPSAPVWNGDMLKNPNGWREFASKFKYERGGFGNAVVQRSVFEKIHGHDERFFGVGRHRHRPLLPHAQERACDQPGRHWRSASPPSAASSSSIEEGPGDDEAKQEALGGIEVDREESEQVGRCPLPVASFVLRGS